MAQSYGSNSARMVTPYNHRQAQVFSIAAADCGLANEWLIDALVQLERREERRRRGSNQMQLIVEEARDISQAFCLP